jgi:hypothetical protein
MSKERFKEFMRFLRFDKETLADRRKNDKSAAEKLLMLLAIHVRSAT